MSKTRLLIKCRSELIDIHRHALATIKPENLIRNSIRVSDGPSLEVTNETRCLRYDLSNTRIHVVGGGKSVMAMAKGLADLAQHYSIQDKFSLGSLSLPVGQESPVCEEFLRSIGVKCYFGSENNLPDQASVEASKVLFNTISDACQSDQVERRNSLFIVLVSGGGSACLTSPRLVDLSSKLGMIKFLVQRGVNIVDLNKVRRYYSNIKGGGLARHILSRNPKSKILSLILSDVIGDPVEFIASGPAYLDHRLTAQVQEDQALEVLQRYKYPMQSNPIQGSANECDEIDVSTETNLVNLIIGNNQLAIDSAIRRAQALGYQVLNLGSDLQGETRNVLNRLVDAARDQFQSSGVDRLLAIGGGEATVKKADDETWGVGGRAQEMALDYLISCLSSKQPEVHQNSIDMLLAGTTDGQDGPTDVGACLASYAEAVDDLTHRQIKLEDALKAKKSHDSYNFWNIRKPDWLVKTGLTGTNVMDLYMYSLTTSEESFDAPSRALSNAHELHEM